ncbi:MAG: hypothetical protein OEV36_05990 [Myxococcales bacterium]|nr:hypothetical protein [Myxococcales bacterium]
MTSGNDSPGAGLGERLLELDPPEPAEPAEGLARMFGEVKSRCEASDRTIPGFLRSRSTVARRAIVLAVFALLLFVGWFVFPLVGDHARTAPWMASLVTFCVLLLLAMLMVTRPVHLPELPRWQIIGLVSVAIGATIVAAFWPIPAAQAATPEHAGGVMAGVCMGVGLLLGVPVYALLRLLDRGHALGSVVAAAAAGLGANFVLKAHCPIPGTSHELLGHASVALVFVLGLGLVHHWLPQKPR